MAIPKDRTGDNDADDIRIVEITREPVELYKILKFEGMVTSGGEAKLVVADGQVRVNGKVDTQKRKKITAGDTVEFNNETIRISLAPKPTEVTAPEAQALGTRHVIEEENNGNE